MLMHHGNSERSRFAGRMNHHGRPVKFNRSRIRLHGPVNNLHQRGLAGAVFAEHREHLAGINFKADAVVRPHAGINFGDVFEPQSRRHSGIS